MSRFAKTFQARLQRPIAVVIIGPGRWGQALASVLATKNVGIDYLSGSSSPADWNRAFQQEKLVLVATPFKALEPILKQLKPYRKRIMGILNASKGIDRKTLLTFSSLAQKSFPQTPLATLSGPTFADEVLAKCPSACAIAGSDRAYLKFLRELFGSPYFRAYSSLDPVGVEVCGAVKNVLAIACGISDGLRLGQNARAALLTRGLREMASLVQVLGGKSQTVYGLAGVGDLWLTATGDLSRNRQLGLMIASGVSLDEGLKKLAGPSEGYYTAEQIHKLAKKLKLDLPICEQIFQICFKGEDPRRSLTTLMSRESGHEESKPSKRLKTIGAKLRLRS